jgi:hypothetical protein
MRAILRNEQGKSVETVVSNPPPYAIKRRGDVWTNRDADLHEWNSSGILYFKFDHQVLNPHSPNLDTAYYDEVPEEPKKAEKPTAATYDDITKATLKIIQPQIIAQVEAGNQLYNHYAKSHALAGTKKELLNLVAFDALKVVEEHKKKYGYGKETEERMAEIGQYNLAHENELPFDYLTRLLGIVHSENLAYDESLKAKYKASWPQQPGAWVSQAVTQTNSLPSYQVFQPGEIGNLDQYVRPWITKLPEVVKPKRELPDPIEPKRRFMKKR